FAAFPKWYTLTKRNLGNAYYAIGDYGRALDLQEQSLTLSQNAREFYGVMQALGNIGNVTSAQGDFSRSIEAYEQCLKWSQQLGIPLEAAQAKLGLGNNYAFQGEYEKARDYYQQSLVLSQSLGSRLGEGIALTNLGEALSKLGLLVEAEAPLYEAIEVWESLRAGLGNSDDYKVSLFETQQRAYRNLQAVLITQNEDKQKRALEIAERGRARAFLELLAREDNPDTTSQGLRPQTLEELSAVANSQQATLVEYSILREQAVRRPHGASPQYSEVTELEVALLTWVIAADGNVTFHEQPISPQTPLNHWIETVRSSLGVRTRAATLTVESTRESNTDESLKQLYQLLIAPIQAQLPPDAAQRVVFIPQGELFLVPFPALMDANNNYLIEQHTVSTAPSIQVLDKIRSRSLDTGNRPEHNSASNTDILAVGNPMMPTIWNAQSNTTAQLSALAGAEQEAQTIASFFDTEALLGDQATEQAIKQRMTTARIVHLATHGLLEYGNPEESGVRDMPGAIALAPGNGDDGLLTSAEILDGLTLQAELVVLSACDTGLGTITGDGVIGLSRSLIAAGTPSVVVSLWAIPDAPTASLMTEFYAQMQQ
ncbi:MAG: CHAT domain-containing tetratricopeptide repeat protein, partial [Cyanobacteria bacterium J06635_11]